MEGFDPLHQNADAEGFCHVVIGTYRKADQLIRFFGFGREHDDNGRGGFGFAPQASADLNAIDDREHDVQQDDVG